LPATGLAAAGRLQNLIAVHYVGDFFVAIAAQRGGDEMKRGVSLRLCEVAEAQTVPLKNSAGQVRPARSLAARETECDFCLLRRAQCGQKCVGRFDDTWRHRSLLGTDCERKHERETNQADPHGHPPGSI